MVANPNWYGDPVPAQELIFKWSTEAAQRLVELQSGQVDGIDNVGVDDFSAVEGDSTLKLYPREGLNTMYLGMNNTYRPFNNEKVRQAVAMGIDRQRIVDNFYAPGSVVATQFTPCSIPNACVGPEWYPFDPAAAKALLAEGLAEEGITGTNPLKTTIHLRDVNRSYIANPTVIAQDIQAQLKANLGIEAAIDVQESGTFIDNADAGKLDGIHILGWGADYPDMTNFVDYHFGAGASAQFGDKYPDLVAAIQEGAQGLSDEAREPAYEKVNELIKQHVPMLPVAHAGSAVAFKADVEGAHASPLSNEIFSVMKPGDRTQLVWLQNGEPPGLYCADESDGEALRACEQMTQSLYEYETAGTAALPALATACTPSADLMTWTCTLRDGVKYANGATFDANDVVVSYAAQWDTENPLHKGRDGSFTYFPALFGGFLNPPPAE
jgi:ABC-type transport system substrate-binding protein